MIRPRIGTLMLTTMLAAALWLTAAASAQSGGSELPTRGDTASQAGDQDTKTDRPARPPQRDSRPDRTKRPGDDLQKAGDKPAKDAKAAPEKEREEPLVRKLAKEEKKYRERLAKIRRIEEIAREQGNEKLLARIAAARTRIEEAHKRKIEKLREKHGAAELDQARQRVQRGLAQKASKAKGKGKGAGEKGANGGKGDAGLDGGRDLVTICHVPPDNPERRVTIRVSRDALEAHLAHGDTLGPCEGDEDPAANRPSRSDRPRGSAETPRSSSGGSGRSDRGKGTGKGNGKEKR